MPGVPASYTVLKSLSGGFVSGFVSGSGGAAWSPCDCNLLVTLFSTLCFTMLSANSTAA